MTLDEQAKTIAEKWELVSLLSGHKTGLDINEIILEAIKEGILVGSELERVSVQRDDSGHWYVLPATDAPEFGSDLSNVDMEYSGEFDEKWGDYMTGGDLNLVDLYAPKRR